MKTYGELEVQLHEILASTTRKINSSRPICFIPEEYLQVSILIPTSNYEKIGSKSTRNIIIIEGNIARNQKET